MPGPLRNRIVMVVLSIFLLVGLVGCAGFKVVPMEPTNPKASSAKLAETVTGPLHDVAVISLDVDPPLRVLQVGQPTANISLLAAIDNKGTYTERQVAVTASLRAEDNGELLAQRREVLGSLAPGEASIVRFEGFDRLPKRDGYILSVTVEPVPGEQDIANNTQVMPLQFILSQ
ncbi:MAG: hypothetical protein ACYC1C_11430 [Chloroflexota bacterium]